MPAPQDLTVHSDNGVHPLSVAQLRSFLDPVERMLGRATENRKDGDIRQKTHAIVPPFPRRDHTSIKTKDMCQFPAIKGDRLRL